jgi:hypothetical protein
MKTGIEFKQDKKGMDVKIYGARASYAYLNAPDEKGTYRSQFIIPKTAAGVDAFKAAYIEYGKSAFPGAWKSAAFKDGDRIIADKSEIGGEVTEMQHYAGSVVFSGMTFADKKTGKLPDIRGNCYSGCYLAVILRICPYDFKDETTGTRQVGLHAYINGVKFMEDGEKLGGERANADSLDVPDPDPLQDMGKKPEAAKPYTDEIPF